MVLAASFFACIVLAPETAKEALENVIRHYQSLNSYSATIECHDASGLFPGNYEQTLKWKKGGRFEIVVTKKSDYSPNPDTPGSQAPDYFSNGTDVLTRRVDGSTSVHSIVVDPNTTPGWQVTTGLILGWLQQTPSSKFLIDPPQGFKTSFEWGEKKQWTGTPVRELIVKIEGQGRNVALSLFLSLDMPELVGQEFQRNGKRQWTRYRDAKNNPDLPATLGDHPK